MLILLRHGRTPNNRDARLQGQSDSPLDEVGREQARLAGEYLRRRYDIDAVVTSPLTRTIQTVEAAGFGGDGVSFDERWREIDFGEYDERRIGEVIADLNDRWRADPGYTPADGESMSAMHDRVVGACLDLADAAQTENVLVVTHATPIKSAAVWALDGSAEMILNLWVNLATVTVLDHVADNVVLREFNSRASE